MSNYIDAKKKKKLFRSRNKLEIYYRQFNKNAIYYSGFTAFTKADQMCRILGCNFEGVYFASDHNEIKKKKINDLKYLWHGPVL